MFEFRDSFEEGNLSKWSLVDTSIAISSLQAFRGVNSARVNGTTTTGFVRYDFTAANYTTPGYQRVYFRIASATIGGTPVQILRFSDVSNTHVGSIRIDSSLQLGLYNAANSQIGSSTAALNTNQWYCLELKITAPSDPGTLEARLDGVVFASGNNSSQGSWGRASVGSITPSATIDFYFDEYAFSSVDYPGLISDLGSKDISLDFGGTGTDISLSAAAVTTYTASVFDTIGITESNTSELNSFAAPFETIAITEDVYRSPFLFGIETVEDFLALPWNFTDYYEDGGTVNIDTTSKVNGVNSLRFDGSGPDNIALIARHLATQQSSIFVRMSGFFPTGFSFGTAGYSGILSGVTFGNTNSFYFNLEDYGAIRLSVNGDNITFRDTGIDLPVNSVWTLQIQVIKSATVGRVRVWLNNSVEASPDYDSGDINSGTIGIDKIHFGKTYVPDTVDSFYLDDFIIDDEYILPSFASPTVNTFDAIGITESTSAELTHDLSVFDAVGITENVTPDLTALISVFDAVGMAENVASDLVSVASVFDAVGITENVTLDLTHNLSTFDAVAITEGVTPDLTFNVSTFDALTIAESVVASIVLEASVFDLITIEDIPLYYPDHIYIEESVVVVLVIPPFEASVFDSIAILESNTQELNQFVSVFDAIGIAENITLDLVSNVSVFDAVSIAETVTLELNGQANVFDAVAIAESVTVSLDTLTVGVFDAVGITEDFAPSATGNLEVNVFDAIGITESITLENTVNQSVFDAIGVTENVALLIDIPVLTINTFDIIGIEEFITSETAASVAVQDNITIAEEVNPNQIFNAQLLFDSIVFAESIISETIRFSPESPNKRPRGRRAQIVPRGSASTPQQTGSRINIAGKGVVTSR